MSAPLPGGGDQPPERPVGAVAILLRIALIFLIIPMLLTLAARYLF